MSQRLKNALDLVESDKIKDRTEGIAELRELLASAKVLDGITDSGSWPSLLQKLFRCVVTERNLQVKKPTTAVETRLKSAAQTVRWIVERAAARLERKAIRPLHTHLLQTSIVRNALFPAVSTEYIKALRVLLDYRPHLEHLDQQEWHETVTFCFACIFGDPINLQRDISRYGEDSMNVDELDEEAAATGGSQRNGRAGQQEADLMACIERLFTSSSAPLVQHASDLLSRFNRFFRMYPAETTAHLYAVGALNELLKQLEFNAIEATTKAAPGLWTAILDLWLTKSTFLREALAISLRLLFPFIKRQDKPEALLSACWTKIKEDTDLRWRIEDLKLESLALRGTDSGISCPFSTTNFSMASSFSASQALAWHALELGADCLAQLFVESDRVQPAEVTPGRAKRRKIDNPLNVLLSDLEEVSTTASLHRLQVLVFLIDRHWGKLHDDMKRSVSDTLHRLLARLDTSHIDLQNWAFLGMARIAGSSTPGPGPSPPISPVSSLPWETIWNMAMRRLSLSATSRTACHAAERIMAADRIPHARLVADVQSLLEHDLLIMGPTFPYDSTCALLSRCLDFARKDAHLFRMNLGSRVTSWLAAHLTYTPRCPLDVPGLIAVCTTISIGAPGPAVSSSTLLPSGKLGEFAQFRKNTDAMRRFIFDADIQETPFPASPIVTAVPSAADNGKQEFGLLGVLARALKSIMNEAGETDKKQYWLSLSVDRTRYILDVAVLTILLYGMLDASDCLPPTIQLRQACEVIEAASVQFEGAHRAAREKWILVAAFEPLLLPATNDRTTSIIMPPGRSSNVPRAVLQAALAPLGFGAEDIARRNLLHRIWKQDMVMKASAKVREALLRFLGSEKGGHDMDDDIKGDSMFAERVATVTHSGAILDSDDALASAFAPFAVRFVTSTDTLHGLEAAPARAPELLAVLEDAETEKAFPIVEHLFKAVNDGYASLSLAEADTILEMIGGDYSVSKLCKGLSISGLAKQARNLAYIAKARLDIDEASTSFRSNARKLCSWYGQLLNKGRISSWRIRQRFVEFLECCLKNDPDQQAWQINTLPSELLPPLTGDPDFRVRYTASVCPAYLYPLAKQHDRVDNVAVAERAVFRAFGPHTPNNIDDFERNLTTFLVLANTMIAASSQRVDPYSHMIAQADEKKTYEPYVASVFAMVSRRLGMADRANLHAYMAAPVAQRSSNKGDTARDRAVSELVSGFASRQAATEATFESVGAIWLAKGDTAAFKAHCQLAGRPTGAGATICFPLAAATVICKSFESNADETAIEQAWRGVEALAKATDLRDKSWQKAVVNSMDQVAASMLLSVWETDPNEYGPYAVTLSEMKRLDAAEAYFSLSRDTQTKELPRPAFRSYSAQTVCRALQWLETLTPVMSNKATIYRIAHWMIAKAASAHFVHEQRCFLYNLDFFIAMCGEHIRHPGIQRLLLHGSITLMARSDLTQICFAQVQYLLNNLLSDSERQPVRALGGLLLSGARILHRLVANAHSESAKTWAGEHLAYLGKLLQSMLQDGSDQKEGLRSMATQAGSLWPIELDPPLSNDYEQLCGILESQSLPSGKFALALAFEKCDADADDLKPVVWRMMAALRASEDPSLHQSLAFSRLLLETGGQTIAPSKAPRTSDELRPIALEIDIQNDLVLKISDLMSSSSLGTVVKAAQAIYLLASLSADRAFSYAASQPGLCAGEIALLAERQLLRAHEARVVTQKRRLDEVKKDEWLGMARDFPKWVVHFALLIADLRSKDVPIYGQLGNLLANASFARDVLPMLLHSLLTADLGVKDTPAAVQISQYFSELVTRAEVDREVVRCIIDIVSYLRGFRQDASTPSSEDQWFPELSWLVLATGAVRCSMHTSALLFLELEHEHIGLDLGGPATDGSQTARDLLYEIYESIDEPDGFYGIPVLHPADAVLRQYKHEKRPFDAFGLQGARYESVSRDQDTTLSLVECISNFGLNRLAFALLEPARSAGVVREDAIPAQLPFHMAWRSASWSLPVESTPDRSSSASTYAALRAIHRERDAHAISDIIADAVAIETRKLVTVDLNSPVPDKRAITALLGLHEVHRWHNAIANGQGGIRTAIAACLEPTQSDLSFSVAEELLLLRTSLLQSTVNSEGVSEVASKEATVAQHACLLRLSELAREGRHLQASMNAVNAASILSVASAETLSGAAEYARVLWAKGEHALAIDGLAGVLRSLRSSKSTAPESQLLQSRLLCDLGSWNATARLQSAEDIISTYFEPAELIADTDPKQYSHVFLAYANFADAKLRAQETQKDEMRKLEAYQDRKQIELELMPSGRASSSAQSSASSASNTSAEHARKAAVSRLELDRLRLEKFQEEGAASLALAMRLYARVLVTTDKHDEVVFRLAALWLEHHADADFNDEFAGSLAMIPSRKFVVLAHQLSARLSKTAESAPSFRSSLEDLVGRLSKEHPFHVLYHIYSLRASASAANHIAATAAPKTRKSLGLDGPTPSQAGRQKIASDFFALAKTEKRLQTRVLQLEAACEAYVEVANMPRSEAKKNAMELPVGLKLFKLKDLAIPVSTYNLPVDIEAVYSPARLPCIGRYDKKATVMGGINQPKAIWCTSTLGTRFRQLCKGGDDVRQDAVMQQVFGIVNHFLKTNATTRARNLHVRCYKVIPLVGATGLLEFVPNTRPLGLVLEPLHKLYRPKDLDFKKARDMMKDVSHKNAATRVQTFKEILTRIRPVLRHHFRDRRKLATPWFEMRLAYQRSVAVNAIVGWMLGIGDRHVSNLLFDDSTGELVPIDFGVAFDAGELLPIPELVPFRLTQDIVDGLGLTGTNGVFRRCAEETLRVLRQQSDTIMSILEVLKYDPLQRWTLTTGKAKKVQSPQMSGRAPQDTSTDNEDVPADAARALAGVAAKLSNALSVEQRITVLVREATAPEHLATIFYGWQPYL